MRQKNPQRTQVALKAGIKKVPETQAELIVTDLQERLVQHRIDLIMERGGMRGVALFQTQCGELFQFVSRCVKKGKYTITVRVIGEAEYNAKFLQFAYTDDLGNLCTCTVHQDCLRNKKPIASDDDFLYEPIAPAQSVA